MTKQCRKCEVVKTRPEFVPRKRGSKDGMGPYCRVCFRKINLEWKRRNIDEVREKQALARRTKYKQDPRKMIDETRAWKKRNPEAARKSYAKSKRKWSAKKRKNCPEFKVESNLRRRIRFCIKGIKKQHRFIDLLGCSVGFLKSRLESMFLPGMSWENYSRRGWNIDHIRPCASFDLNDQEQRKQCFHFTNLQPLWAIDNIIKSDKYEPAA